MGDPPHVEGVLAGGGSALQDESFHSNEDITRPHNSTLNQDDANLLSQHLNFPTEERKIQYDEDLQNKVVKTSDEWFNNAEGSPISSKMLKIN